MAKKWFMSKTLWVNFIAVASMLLAPKLGFDLSAEYGVPILGVINLGLRIITDAPVEW